MCPTNGGHIICQFKNELLTKKTAFLFLEIQDVHPGYPNLTTEPSADYHSTGKERLPEAVSLPFAIDEIFAAGQSGQS